MTFSDQQIEQALEELDSELQAAAKQPASKVHAEIVAKIEALRQKEYSAERGEEIRELAEELAKYGREVLNNVKQNTLDTKVDMPKSQRDFVESRVRKSIRDSVPPTEADRSSTKARRGSRRRRSLI